MKPLRVLHVYRSYYPESLGGMEEAIRQLCLATNELGVINTIFTLARQPRPPQLLLPEGVHVREKCWAEIASCNIGGLAAWSSFRRLARENDVIQLHYPWPFGDLLVLGAPRRPTVVTYVSDIVRQKWIEPLYAPLRERLLQRADSIVASSPNYMATSPVLKRYSGKAHYIPHGLGQQAPADPGRVDVWRKRYGEKFFLFIGVLRYYKGLRTLIKAAALGGHPVVIAGDGPEAATLRELAASLGASSVHFTGRVSEEDKRALLQLCQALVLPSHLRSEAFGMTLLEGAEASKALICCDIGSGTTWINQHRETGLVVPPDDSAGLARAMSELAADDALCRALGRTARMRWQRFFAREVVARDYRALYERLVSAER